VEGREHLVALKVRVVQHLHFLQLVQLVGVMGVLVIVLPHHRPEQMVAQVVLVPVLGAAPVHKARPVDWEIPQLPPQAKETMAAEVTMSLAIKLMVVEVEVPEQ
jgi:hypothetical protein